MTSKSSISLEGYLYTALRSAANVHVSWPTSVLSRKLKRHHYHIEHLNETLQCQNVGPTTQCVSKTYRMFQLSATVPNLCLEPKSSLINRLINDRLLDAWRTEKSNSLLHNDKRTCLHTINELPCRTAQQVPARRPGITTGFSQARSCHTRR